MTRLNIVSEGPIFEAVQQQRIFPDCKTFVDATPKSDPAWIQQQFEQQKKQTQFNLAEFVDTHFTIPSDNSSFESNSSQDMADHINQLWPHLRREAHDQHDENSSLLPLPKPYIVPGGRFREIYYWDSYFTAEGLACSGHIDLVINMTRNFAHLIDIVGHVPNGNRQYYLSRSQPPFFSCLLDIIQREQSIDAIIEFLPQLEKEYQFWMDGAEQLSAEHPENRRVVILEDGSVLNRYWDDHPAPRPESYREDVALFNEASQPEREHLYRNIRAACESGWDFSSRWLRDPTNLTSIYTTELIPIDLNCLLLHMEHKLIEIYTHLGNENKADEYRTAAEKRSAAINQYLWSEPQQFYYDYCWTERQQSKCNSLATVYPLFFQASSQRQADAVAQRLQNDFLQDGGLVTTPNKTDQQWDSPNGWAPLQWLAIQGLCHYQHDELARDIARYWVQLNRNVFANTGKMLEKYNVCDASLFAGGGEYPLQDGFGWTNGVAIALIEQFGL